MCVYEWDHKGLCLRKLLILLGVYYCGFAHPEDVNDDERNLAYQQVRSIIDNDLSSNQRLIIDLREVEGLEFDDIAQRLGMQPVTVRVELSRARKRVREIYQSRLKEKNS